MDGSTSFTREGSLTPLEVGNGNTRGNAPVSDGALMRSVEHRERSGPASGSEPPFRRERRERGQSA
jgi:hypothetical protein